MKSHTTRLGVVGILLICCATLNAQTFTVQSGNWNSPSTWSGGIVPDASSDAIVINHKVNVTAGSSLVVDELTLNDSLLIEAGSTFILNNAKGAAVDLQVLSGGLKVRGRLICRDSATFSGTTMSNTFFYDGSTYEHQYFNSAGTPPTATWSTNSNLEITGYITTKTLNNVLWSQSFGNVIYNCPNQIASAVTEFAGRLKIIKGNFLIHSTGKSYIRLSIDATTSAEINIGGNLIIDGESLVWFSRAATTSVFIGGDFKILSTATASSYVTTTGNCQINVAGNFEMNSPSILRFASGTSNGKGVLRVKKNFTFKAGTIRISTGNGTGLVELNGSSPQLFSSLGTWLNGVNLQISNSTGVSAQANSKVEGNIQVNANAQLKLPSGNFTLQGDLTLQPNGSIESKDNTLLLAGSLNQSITLASDTLHHITINKTSNTSVSFSDLANLRGILSVSSVNTTVFANGNLTLLSSSDDGNGDASIYTLPSGSSVAGEVTIQRNMRGEGRIYRYLSSPVKNATVRALMDDFPVTGAFQDPSTGAGIRSASPSFFYYDETLTGTLGWIGYPFSGLAEQNSLVVGRGYAAFIREASQATTWDVTGEINQGDLALPVTFQNTNDPATDGWNLVGNPYPSAIDWNAIGGWDKVHIDNGIAIRDNGTGSFLYWDGAIGSLGSGRIAKGQSFWIKTNDLNPTLKIKEVAKTNATTSFYRTKTNDLDYVEVSIQSLQHQDKTYLRIRDQSSDGYDSLDVVKFSNDMMNLSFEASKTPLAISAVGQLDCSQHYPINLSFARKSDGSFVQSPIGTYQISVAAFGLFEQGEIILNDHFLNIDFRLDNSPYDFSITSDSASFRSDRFSLKFNSEPLNDLVSIVADSALCDTSPFYNIQLKNVQHNERYEVWMKDVEIASFHSLLTDSLSFEMESSELSNGKTKFTIMSNNLCHAKVIESFNLWKQETYAPALFADLACNQETTRLHIENAKDAIAFNWYDHEKKLLNQTLDSSLVVSIIKPTTFYAASVFNHGCVSDTMGVQATIVRFDPPIITEDQGVLNTTFSLNPEWSFNGAKIAGANLPSLKPTQTGNYSVRINQDGCIDSASYYFIYQDETLQVFPNPVEHDVQVVAPKGEQMLQVEIFNAVGKSIRMVAAVQNAQSETVLVSDLEEGLYFLVVVTTKNRYQSKILKN